MNKSVLQKTTKNYQTTTNLHPFSYKKQIQDYSQNCKKSSSTQQSQSVSSLLSNDLGQLKDLQCSQNLKKQQVNSNKVESLLFQIEGIGYSIEQIEEEQFCPSDSKSSAANFSFNRQFSFADSKPLNLLVEENQSYNENQSTIYKKYKIKHHISKLLQLKQIIKKQCVSIKKELIMFQQEKKTFFKFAQKEVMQKIKEHLLKNKKQMEIAIFTTKQQQNQFIKRQRTLIAEKQLLESQNIRYCQMIKEISSQNLSLKNELSNLFTQSDQLFKNNCQLKKASLDIHDYKLQIRSLGDVTQKQQKYIANLEEKIEDLQIYQDEELAKFKNQMEGYKFRLKEQLQKIAQKANLLIKQCVKNGQQMQKNYVQNLLASNKVIHQLNIFRKNIGQKYFSPGQKCKLNKQFDIQKICTFAHILKSVDHLKIILFDYVSLGQRSYSSNQNNLHIIEKAAEEMQFSCSSKQIKRRKIDQSSVQSISIDYYDSYKGMSDTFVTRCKVESHKIVQQQRQLQISRNQSQNMSDSMYQSCFSERQEESDCKIEEIMFRLREKINEFSFDLNLNS